MRKTDYFKMGDLIDTYGTLLTRKQQDFLKLYYYDNYSIDEIASLKQITKQGVYDLLKRSESRLLSYEDSLGLMKIRKQLTRRDEAIKKLDVLKKEFYNDLPSPRQPEFREAVKDVKILLKGKENV